jgi:hypothetical protein
MLGMHGLIETEVHTGGHLFECVSLRKCVLLAKLLMMSIPEWDTAPMVALPVLLGCLVTGSWNSLNWLGLLSHPANCELKHCQCY